jgi:hypothetical protein
VLGMVTRSARLRRRTSRGIPGGVEAELSEVRIDGHETDVRVVEGRDRREHDYSHRLGEMTAISHGNSVGDDQTPAKMEEKGRQYRSDSHALQLLSH